MDNYDEVVEIKNSREIETPTDLDVTSLLNFVNDKDNSLEEPTEDNNYKNKEKNKIEELRPKSSLKSKHPALNKTESFGTEETDSDSDTESDIIHSHNDTDIHYNPKEYENIDFPADIKELFQYIPRYTPQKIAINYKLKIFIPDFIPAVGDIDAFLKVIPPDLTNNTNNNLKTFINSLSLNILDEPTIKQSEPTILYMKLRSINTNTSNNINESKSNNLQPAIAKTPKLIDKWITDIQQLHINQPVPTVIYNSVKIPDIDTLMAEWPINMEKALDNIGLPNTILDCTLTEYINIILTLLDIPIDNEKQFSNYIIVLNILFNLYIAIKQPIK